VGGCLLEEDHETSSGRCFEHIPLKDKGFKNAHLVDNHPIAELAKRRDSAEKRISLVWAAAGRLW
jgi:hypothetical protein